VIRTTRSEVDQATYYLRVLPAFALEWEISCRPREDDASVTKAEHPFRLPVDFRGL